MEPKRIGVAVGAIAVAVGIASAAFLATSDQGSAQGAPEFVPFANADVTPQLKANVQLKAREQGIRYDSLLEVGGVGTGKYRRRVRRRRLQASM